MFWQLLCHRQLLKIEAKSFSDARQDILRIQKVIWDHLLAFKGEVFQKQALFSLPFRTPNNLRVNCFNIRCLFCFFFRSLFYLTEVIFPSKSRKAWN